ncbi:hypothetical protein C9374_012812 [Naegleria lovaniensis]|uniref:Uncharacterized protein n=1 Tax=Naegleria lovaniensis TaxID=51637 RepID=A0AA88G6R4_NAELO|nr:uncharacterized protein C9374_012812 [Naegleria lovaniensis]KAG2373080.1 hypothetical protein C9374_012812 [Naegleria lovaniensis]
MHQAAQPCLFNEFNEQHRDVPRSRLTTTSSEETQLTKTNPMNAMNNHTQDATESADSMKHHEDHQTLSQQKKKRKQVEMVFMNQSVIYNAEGKKQRNKTIYSLDHPKVLERKDQILPFKVSVGQTVHVSLREYKSEKNISHFDKITVEHLGYTNVNNMDASKTTAIDFVNVVAFKRKSNDSRILWIYEQVLLDQIEGTTLLNCSSLKRKLDSMNESDDEATSEDRMSARSSNHDEESTYSSHNLQVMAANPLSSLLMSNHQQQQQMCMHQEEYGKKTKVESQPGHVNLLSIDPEDAPAKKPTLFQLSIQISESQPYHLFHPLIKQFSIDFIALHENVAFQAGVINVQPVFSYENMANNTIMTKDFIIYGKTPLINNYDNINTFVKLTIDNQIFFTRQDQSYLNFYFYGEDKRMKSVQIIQNPNKTSEGQQHSSATTTQSSSNRAHQENPTVNDLVLFEFDGNEFLFESDLNHCNSCLLMYDRFERLSRQVGCEEAVKTLLHIQDAFGFTLVMHFAARDMADELKLCIDWKANIHQKDMMGRNAMFWASHFKAENAHALLAKHIERQNAQRDVNQIVLSNQIRRGLYTASSRMEKHMKF